MNISEDYLIGFTEGEGMFYIGIVPSSETKTGWQVIYFFKVSQNPKGLSILKELKRILNAGYIKSNSKSDFSDKSLAFVVRDLKSIQNKVIPFFKNKLVIKKDNFEKFCQVIKIVSEKRHLTRKGIEEIINISYPMNTGKRKYSKEEILKSYKF